MDTKNSFKTINTVDDRNDEKLFERIFISFEFTFLVDYSLCYIIKISLNACFKTVFVLCN